ncbi:DUF2971 domain-containing protein [Haloferax sp. Q22]|uniref:DUF2971 domain-containing protein n=1 Tax=Haloferax sp. (strain Q22) TaxID=1526048 RepID=UPI0012F7F9E4|nr:DUF2971 domain-containing protein [Haloferax sp. Q22]
MRQLTFMNCWRQDEYESSSMWRSYTTSSDGVVIRSNIESFIESFEDWDGRLFISNVAYRDFNTGSPFDLESMDITALSPYFLKREEFKDEREIRAVLTDYNDPAMYPVHSVSDVPEPTGEVVRDASVDLNQLIDSIVVHPESKPYLIKTVRHILEKHGLDPELVVKSALKSGSGSED